MAPQQSQNAGTLRIFLAFALHDPNAISAALSGTPGAFTNMTATPPSARQEQSRTFSGPGIRDRATVTPSASESVGPELQVVEVQNATPRSDADLAPQSGAASAAQANVAAEQQLCVLSMSMRASPIAHRESRRGAGPRVGAGKTKTITEQRQINRILPAER